MIEKIQIWVAWKLPHWLIKWASIRMIAHATQGEYSSTLVPALGAMEALKRWVEGKKEEVCRDTL